MRVDERDTMFARMAWEKDGEAYRDYYTKHPDKKERDDMIRSKPNLCSPGTMSYDEVNSKIPEIAFGFLSDISHLSEGKKSETVTKISKEEGARRLKGLAKLYGAELVGITELKEEHLYSHRGRHEKNYGDKVEINHKYAIVFGVLMDREMINRAPMISEIVETSKAYVDVAIVGMIISYFIRSLGYEARNHMDANYLTVLPLVAKDAGIGDIGRNGLLTTKDYGSCLRIGAVTTDLELQVDEPKGFGLEDFCKICGLCARTCPGRAISGGDEFKFIQENCYERWRSLGTDCGVCISACPFSQGLDFIREVDTFEGNEDLINEALKRYKEIYPIRPFIKEKPKWLE